VGSPISLVDDRHAVVEIQDRGYRRVVDERAIRDAPAMGVHTAHVTPGRRPYKVEVVNRHVEDVRMAHRVPEIVRGEERPRVSPAGYLDRRELPELAFHHEPLHGAERSVVTVVLADHKDTLRSICGLDQVEGVLEGGSQRFLTEDVLACLECGLRHHVVRARRRSDQHGVAIDARQRVLQDSVARGGFYITAGFGIGVDDGGELDARGSRHYPGPATAPDTESGLDYADDFLSSS
jgi:hypothetical protein